MIPVDPPPGKFRPDESGRRRSFGMILLVILLGGTFLAVALREVTPRPEGTHLRFAHTLLHGGLREALEAVAREYEAILAAEGITLRVEQLPIPDRIYQQWLRTQLVGGTAPEIIMNQWNLSTSMVGRYLVPLSDRINDPNPYNRGTALAGLRWRETFFDGMDYGGFIFELAEHYGIPISAATTRMYVNRRLLREILADAENADLAAALGPQGVPRTYDDFLSLCAAAQRYGRRQGRALIPIAGSDTNATLLINTLVGSQTQRLLVQEQPMFDFRFSHDLSRLRMLTGERPVVDKYYRAGLLLSREVGQFMQPGFIQQRREDAAFLFTQERALMIAASAWDAASFRELMGPAFDVVVFPIPTPERGHPRAPFSLGPGTESHLTPSGVFGLVNIHPPDKVERGLDFLRYLTSHPGQTTFVQRSGWLPAILGVEPAAGTEGFMPRMEGYPSGPVFHDMGPDHMRALVTHLHLLTSPQGSLATFLESYEAAYRQEIIPSLQASYRNASASTNQQDTLIAAAWWLATRQPSHAHDGNARLGILLDSSHHNEANSLFFQAMLKRILREETLLPEE